MPTAPGSRTDFLFQIGFLGRFQRFLEPEDYLKWSGPLLESRERKAPKWMSEVERRLFRRLLRSEINENRYLSQRKFDGIVDYVRACTRLDDLRERLAKEIVADPIDQARILAFNTQLNSLIALRKKLGEAL